MAEADGSIGIVIGASGGIGRALATELRDRDGLSAVIGIYRQNGDFDLENETSIAMAAQAIAARYGEHPASIIINATGVLDVDGAGPEKSFASLNAESMSRVISINTIGAALVFKHFMPLLARDRPVWFGALSARVGSIGDNRLGGWMSYRASKSALNQIVRCAAIEQARTNKQSVIAALHPGTVETDLTRDFARGKYTARPEQAARDLINVLTDLKPPESGGFYAYDGGEIVW